MLATLALACLLLLMKEGLPHARDHWQGPVTAALERFHPSSWSEVAPNAAQIAAEPDEANKNDAHALNATVDVQQPSLAVSSNTTLPIPDEDVTNQVSVWPRETKRRSDPSERYLGYLPHSGFHNQRVQLQNAMVLAVEMNRTL